MVRHYRVIVAVVAGILLTAVAQVFAPRAVLAQDMWCSPALQQSGWYNC